MRRLQRSSRRLTRLAGLGGRGVVQVGQLDRTEQETPAIAREEVPGGRKGSAHGHSQTTSAIEAPRPEEPTPHLPVEELPLFLDQCRPVQESGLPRGPRQEAACGAIVLMDQGEQIVLPPPGRWQERREYPRVPVHYTVLCRPLPPERSPRPTIHWAAFRDLSVGGAQILLPCRLEPGRQVELAGWIVEHPFRARAEVVGVALSAGSDSTRGLLRHSLKWLTYNGAAADILTMALAQLPGDTSAAPEPERNPDSSPEAVSAGSAAGR